MCRAFGQGGVGWKEPFVLSWKGLISGGRRGMGPSSSNLTLQLPSPVLTLSMERGWDRQKRDSVIHRSLQLINKPDASFGSARWCLPDKNAPQFYGQCQEAPIIFSVRSAPWSLLPPLQVSKRQPHRMHFRLCKNHSENEKFFRGVMHWLAVHPAKTPWRRNWTDAPGAWGPKNTGSLT